MRTTKILILTGILASTFVSNLQLVAAAEKTPAKQSTLSKLGIDFGAAELGRFADLGLNDKQKMEALKVVRDQKPMIDKLCTRMTEALKMREADVSEKEAKQAEMAKILEQFKTVQGQIMGGLHSIITKEQMTKLEAIKKQEEIQKQKLKSKAEGKPDTAS